MNYEFIIHHLCEFFNSSPAKASENRMEKSCALCQKSQFNFVLLHIAKSGQKCYNKVVCDIANDININIYPAITATIMYMPFVINTNSLGGLVMRSKKITELFRRTLPAVMCAAAVLISSGCYLLPDEEEAAVPPAVKASEVSYTTVTAKRKDIEKKLTSTGTVTAERQYDLSYEKQSGVISQFHVRAGDRVAEGDPICEIDTTDLDDQIAEKELYLQKAKLNVDMIWESGGTQAQIDSAYVDVQLIERELNKLKANKEGAVLRSPIDGVVSQLADVRAGDSVNSGQTVATVIDTTALYIAVKPDDLTKFPVDTKVQIRIDQDFYDGTVFMDPNALAEYQAEVKASHDEEDKTGIAYEADTIYVRFDGEAPADALGQLADVILVLDRAENAVVISNNLIKKVDGEQVVYLLKDGEKVAVPVEVGLSTGSQSEILSGVSEGDELVLK